MAEPLARTGPPPNPHRFLVQLVLGLRAFLARLLDLVTPPELTVFEHVFAVIRTQLVGVAAHLRLADLLDAGPLSAEELATRTGANADALDRALRTLSALGVFTRLRDGRFENNRVSRTLRTGALGGPSFAEYFAAPYHAHAWAEFRHTVMTGESAFERVHGKTFWQWCSEHPDDGRAFAASMAAATELDATAIAKEYPWSEIRRVCDVAGGSGTLLTEILATNGGLRGVLFDDGAIVEQALPRLEARGAADRCDLVGGDFFASGSVPTGCDAYILKDILHDWDDARALSILQNVRHAMRDDARLLVIEMLRDDEPSYPLVNLADMQMMCVCSGGRQRTPEQLEALFAKVGLTTRRVLPLAGFASIIEAKIR